MTSQTTNAPLDLAAVRQRLAATSSAEYWRSLEELAETPEFRQFLEREFPLQASEWPEGVGRRGFLKLMGASLALAGATGCIVQPEEKIIPYVRQPEDFVPGQPLVFASSMPLAGYARGVLVESHLGRPTKIEGNSLHPASLGGTDAFMQASILSLYDPDRSQTVLHKGAIDTWERLVTRLTAEMSRQQADGGAGLRIVSGRVTSPTLVRQFAELAERLPNCRVCQYEPLGSESSLTGSQRAFGRPLDAVYDFEAADVVLSLDADFLWALPGSLAYARQFTQRRRLVSDATATAMNRLYVAESTPSLTGSMADHRLPLPPTRIEPLARLIAARLGVEVAEGYETEIAGVSAAWIDAVVSDLESARGRSLVLAGQRQPAAVHALAHAINARLENVGRGVRYIEPVARPTENDQSLVDLVEEMRAGRVSLLLLLGGNPAYDAPADLEFSAALAKVPLSVHLAEYADETSERCTWHVPAAHYLETWSDGRAYDGTASIQQPLIAPLYGGKSAHELLSVLAGRADRAGFEIVEAHWRREFGNEDFADAWQRALHDGVVVDSAAKSVNASLELNDEITPETPSEADAIELVFSADEATFDGRFANNGWLQELPRPLTKLVWDNAALVSPADAERRGLANGDVVEWGFARGTLRAPIWIMPGQAEGCVTLALGYGRTRAGRVGSNVGFNAYAVRTSSQPWIETGVSLKNTGEPYAFVSTHHHWSTEGRDLVRTATPLDQPPRGETEKVDDAGEEPSLYEPFAYEGNAWGMVIDQAACIGCNACVVACQAENNTPIVGKAQVGMGREMHWLRVDRYYQGELANPEAAFQPVPCMHCENAPCELVCPVAATTHSHEGLNQMVYNRCVGTRYCSNNCPYKVRRFNFLAYTDTHEPVLKLLRNPDVTVRSRGVIEKCTYCVQRINAGKIAAELQNRPVADGDVVTACQGACPTRAIVFGNINDPSSRVAALKGSPLNYALLEELGTRPRTTYLPRTRNPHPSLAATERTKEQA